MTSRSYTKSYSRKVNNVTPGSIQFDKLFRENSNRPSAAKSAGTVGKWGITSFTSIRSTNINGRRGDEIHRTFGAKKPKLDYGNQNAQINKNNDPFSFESTEIESSKIDTPTVSSLPKPKKFFKSRNTPQVPQVPIVVPDDTYPDAAIYQVPDSQYGCSTLSTTTTTTTTTITNTTTTMSTTTRVPKTSTKQQKQLTRKISESHDGSSSDTSTRDDGKPPIVLRICKGTARIVSGDNQDKIDNNIDNELETYRITTPSPTKSSPDRKSFSPDIAKVEYKSLRSLSNQRHEQQQQQQQQLPIVTTVSIPLENTDVPNRRTTRSRAKNLNIDFTNQQQLSSSASITTNLSPQQPTTPNHQTSGLSLTLRKSTTDSNNTSISHYDIVKTDCNTNYQKTTNEEQILTTTTTTTALPIETTQELLEILSCDNEQPKPAQNYTSEDEEDEEEEGEGEEEDEEEEDNFNYDNKIIAQNQIEQSSIDLPPPPPPPTILQQQKSYNDNDIDCDIEMNKISSPELENNQLINQQQVFDGDKGVAKTLVDQDWSSESEDNESIKNGNQDISTNNLSSMEVDQQEQEQQEQLKQQQQQLEQQQLQQQQQQQQLDKQQSTSTINEINNSTINNNSNNNNNNNNNNNINKPATKKGSIFKSRSAGATNGSNKRLALYKHKWSDNDKDGSVNQETNVDKNLVKNLSCLNDDDDDNTRRTNESYNFDEEELETTKLTRVVTYPETNNMDFTDDAEAVTSIRCGKNIKGYYTVVKNVKKAHQIQESGEFQEFNDDVDYILDTLRENNPNATRCLSAIRLASKCMAPAFRMHVRAHGTVAKFFKALHDATKDQSLGLCTATVMFVLSQDRLAMDLDRDCLELMLSLLECDASHKYALDDCGLSSVELSKNKEKVRQLCADIQSQGHAKHLNLDNITVGQLAMETLLSLTSRRAGEWFKEELRELGGLEHIVKTIKDCHTYIMTINITKIGWNDLLLDKLRKVDRCLRVLENVTYRNEENQIYLLKYGDGLIVKTLASLYKLCGQEIPIYPTIDVSDKSSTGAVIRECLFAILIVLINLTHRFNKKSFGSLDVGGENGIIDCTLNLLLRVADGLPEEKSFEMIMLSLAFLINLVEQCNDNKKLLILSKSPPALDNIFDCHGSGVDSLIDLFYKHEELARLEEKKTDAILDGKKDSNEQNTEATTAKTKEDIFAETVAKLLQKAGRHMEHHFTGANIVLLLGHLIMDNKEYEMLIREKLPENNFGSMVAVLQKYYNFMNLTASNEVIASNIATVEKVIKFLKLSDARAEEEKNELPLPALEESSMMLDLSSS